MQCSHNKRHACKIVLVPRELKRGLCSLSARLPSPYCPFLSHFEYIDLQTCPGPAPFRTQNCGFICGDLDPI